jgi:hypothetical protein
LLKMMDPARTQTVVNRTLIFIPTKSPEIWMKYLFCPGVVTIAVYFNLVARKFCYLKLSNRKMARHFNLPIQVCKLKMSSLNMVILWTRKFR